MRGQGTGLIGETRHRRRSRKMLLGVLFVVLFVAVSASTFALLRLHDLVSIPGPAVLHLGHEKIGHAVLPLPTGWRVRPNGIDKFHQCAALIDAASVPRLTACA